MEETSTPQAHEHEFLDYPDGKRCPCGLAAPTPEEVIAEGSAHTESGENVEETPAEEVPVSPVEEPVTEVTPPVEQETPEVSPEVSEVSFRDIVKADISVVVVKLDELKAFLGKILTDL